MRIPFYKMQGCGNSYVFFDCRRLAPQDSFMQKCARQVSDTNFGIGADGAVFLCRDETAFCRMRMFNKDGSEGAMCGNALRCVGRMYADKLPFEVATAAGMRWVYTKNGEISANMGRVTVRGTHSFAINKKGGRALYVDAGNGHLVMFDADRRVLAYLLHLAEQKDLNLMLAKRISPQSFYVVPHERGSGVTLSCGSGACAVAAAAVQENLADPQKEVLIFSRGGTLKVNFDKGQTILSGPAEFICHGWYENKAIFL